MKVIFFDYKKRDDVKCPYLVADVKELVEQHRQDKSVCFISVANSLLFSTSMNVHARIHLGDI